MTAPPAILAKIEVLEPRANSWLRWAADRPESQFFDANGGLLVVAGTTGKLSHPTSEDAARALARAASALPIGWMIGARDAVRAFVAARADGADFRLDGPSSDMALDAPPPPTARRASNGHATTVAALTGDSDPSADLPPPFDRWMRDFSGDRFPDAGGPPPVRPSELWVWVDGEPVAMAGALSTRPTDLRIVTVWTPIPLRGNGYAAALVAAIGRDALARGIPYVTLNVQTDNVPAVRAYERAGFVHVAESENWIRKR